MNMEVETIPSASASCECKKVSFGEQYTMYQKINVTLKLRIIFPRFGAHLFFHSNIPRFSCMVGLLFCLLCATNWILDVAVIVVPLFHAANAKILLYRIKPFFHKGTSLYYVSKMTGWVGCYNYSTGMLQRVAGESDFIFADPWVIWISQPLGKWDQPGTVDIFTM